LDVIDLVDLVWVWVEVRFGQGFVWEGLVYLWGLGLSEVYELNDGDW